MNKIVLGTVQFGLDYGISNSRGQVPKNEVFEILNYALKNNINFLDTAFAYGNSEQVLGEYFESNFNDFNKNSVFKIVSKLPAKTDDVRQFFEKSLENLKQEKIYGYLTHDFASFKNDENIWNEFLKLKAEDKVQKIGFSLYYPTDLEFVLDKEIAFDIVQIPYNLFDRRFEPYFAELKKRKIEIHTRSAFLQGLVFKKPDDLSDHFNPIKSKLTRLKKLSVERNIPIFALCLNFANLNKFIDGVVVGVDSLANFTELLDYSKYTKLTEDILDELYCFEENDENIILPFNWK